MMLYRKFLINLSGMKFATLPQYSVLLSPLLFQWMLLALIESQARILGSILDMLSLYHSHSIYQKFLSPHLTYIVNLSAHLLHLWDHLGPCFSNSLPGLLNSSPHIHFCSLLFHSSRSRRISKKANRIMSLPCLKPFIFILHFINLQSFCLCICLSACDYNPPLEFILHVRKAISAYFCFSSNFHSAW